MPGGSAATQSSRCGKRPNEPVRASATMRKTPVFLAKIWKGRRTSRVMAGADTSEFRLGLRFIDRPDHVKRSLRVVFELIPQDSLTAVQRVLEADELSLEAGELLGREEGLGEKMLQP